MRGGRRDPRKGDREARRIEPLFGPSSRHPPHNRNRPMERSGRPASPQCSRKTTRELQHPRVVHSPPYLSRIPRPSLQTPGVRSRAVNPSRWDASPRRPDPAPRPGPKTRANHLNIDGQNGHMSINAPSKSTMKRFCSRSRTRVMKMALETRSWTAPDHESMDLGAAHPPFGKSSALGAMAAPPAGFRFDVVRREKLSNADCDPAPRRPGPYQRQGKVSLQESDCREASPSRALQRLAARRPESGWRSLGRGRPTSPRAEQVLQTRAIPPANAPGLP